MGSPTRRSTGCARWTTRRPSWNCPPTAHGRRNSTTRAGGPSSASTPRPPPHSGAWPGGTGPPPSSPYWRAGRFSCRVSPGRRTSLSAAPSPTGEAPERPVSSASSSTPSRCASICPARSPCPRPSPVPAPSSARPSPTRTFPSSASSNWSTRPAAHPVHPSSRPCWPGCPNAGTCCTCLEWTPSRCRSTTPLPSSTSPSRRPTPRAEYPGTSTMRRPSSTTTRPSDGPDICGTCSRTWPAIPNGTCAPWS